jgi:hypothetical protein
VAFALLLGGVCTTGRVAMRHEETGCRRAYHLRADDIETHVFPAFWFPLRARFRESRPIQLHGHDRREAAKSTRQAISLTQSQAPWLTGRPTPAPLTCANAFLRLSDLGRERRTASSAPASALVGRGRRFTHSILLPSTSLATARSRRSVPSSRRKGRRLRSSSLGRT